MNVVPGARLGPYEIVSRIGAGGMGQVFRARDLRLERDVAVKVLPAEYARDMQMKLRFEREAKAISQLNHPHICTLYDVGDDYLVMELLDGESLAERIARGPLPLADVLKFGAQIADALDRAHRAGIVHRDLKPANVMLTKTGAKLLDFGLAKSTQVDVEPDSDTMKLEAVTEKGAVFGTFQYMAPEQLAAEHVDGRADIFALGAVLYEMATGRRAFEGTSRTSLIAAIVGKHPRPLSEILPLTPPALDHVILKCLEKEREHRWQSAYDVAEELRWIASAPAAGGVHKTRFNAIATIAAIVLAIALAGVTALYLRARNAAPPRTAFEIRAPKGYAISTRLVSPDGTMIGFSARNTKSEGGIWLRRIDQIEPRRLTTSPDDSLVAWSPDSKSVAYTAMGPNGRQLMTIDVGSSTPEVFSSHVKVLTDATWGPDGTIVYSFGDGLFAVRRDGIKPRSVTTLDAKRRESLHGSPHFLSDGKRFVYLVRTVPEEKNEIRAGSLDGKVRQSILRADGLIGIARSELYFFRDGAIYAQRLDEDDLRVEGEPRRVAERVSFSEKWATAGASVADDGALLYRPVVQRMVELGWYDRDGRLLEKVFEDLETHARSLSRDRTRIAALKTDPSKGAEDVYVIDLARGIQTRVTTGLSNHASPHWSPAGDRVYFASDRDGSYDIYSQSEDGSERPVAIWKSDHNKEVEDVSPGGDALIVGVYSADTRNDLWLVPVAAPETRRPLVATEANDDAARFSPDGAWIAWLSDRSGRNEVYMRRLGGGRTTQISTTGANAFIWSAESTEILVRTAANERVIVPLTFDGDSVTPRAPTSTFPPPAKDNRIIAVTPRGLLVSWIADGVEGDLLVYSSP